MKKKLRLSIIGSLLSVALAFPCVSCDNKDDIRESDDPPMETLGKTLVVYYSHTGNTSEMAMQIKNATGADIFEIVPRDPYPADIDECATQARKEMSQGYKPPLKTLLDNIDQYDTIFVGSPCWWATIACPVTTFLSSYDFTGKNIVPFMTHGGSQLGHSVEDMKKMPPIRLYKSISRSWNRC